MKFFLTDFQALKKEENRTKKMEELMKLDERKRPYPFLPKINFDRLFVS